MASFNELLTNAGLRPTDVAVLRHHTPQAGVSASTLFDLWRDDPGGFTLYQDTQKANRPIFRKRKIWAAFASPAAGETVFLGLFNAAVKETREADWLCPYRGNAPGDGKPIDLFATTPRPELSEQIGRMRVDWPSENVRSWKRKAEGLLLPVVAGSLVRTQAGPLAGRELMGELEALGFEQKSTTKKLVQLRRGTFIVYVKRETLTRPLVLHPHFLNLAEDLRAMGGIDVPDPARTYVNSNLRAFPVYLADHRKSAGRHGFAIGVGAGRLAALIGLLDQAATIATNEGEVRVIAPEDDPLTECERLQAARVGQGDFRNELLIYWDGTCPVAGVDHTGLLRASHIKPWSESTNTERLDPYNGLLLCAHIDALFDRHLITFEDDGCILISTAVSAENRERLGLRCDLKIPGLDTRHAPSLAHHRRQFQP